MGCCVHRILSRRRVLDLQITAGYWIDSQQSIPLMCFTSNCAEVVLSHNHSFVNCISPLLWWWQPITTVSVGKMHIVAVDTEVNVLWRLIWSATSTPGILGFQTNFHTMNHVVQIWNARNVAQGSSGIAYLLQQMWSSFHFPGTYSFRSIRYYQDTLVQRSCQLNWVQCSIWSWNYLDQTSPRHSVLVPYTLLSVGPFSFLPQLAISDTVGYGNQL